MSILKPCLSKKKLDSLLKYTFAVLLVFIPLYPKFPLLTLPFTSVAIRLEDFIIAFLGLLLLASLPYYFKCFKNSLLVQSLLIFFLAGLLAVLSGALLTHTVSFKLALLHWLRRLEYALPFFAGLLLAKRKNLKFFVEIIIIVSLGVLLYGLAQIYLKAPVISTQNPEFAKGLALTLQPGVNLASTFAGHYDLATYLVMTLTLFSALIFILKKTWHKFLLILLSLGLFWLQLRTGSRIAFFALLISLSFSLLLSRKPVWILPVFVVAFLGLANTPAIAHRFGSLIKILQFKNLQNQVQGVFHSRTSLIKSVYAQDQPTPTPTLRPLQQDRSTSIRFDVEWPRALRSFTKNPFLGTGYGSLGLATDNDYLRVLGETGLLGLSAFLAVLFSLLATFLKGLSELKDKLTSQFVIGVFSSVLGFLAIATFLDVFEASKVATLFWMYSGLACGFIIKQTDQ